MPGTFSRRDFLVGVLATGTASAAAIYLAPGGRALPAATLRMVTGADPTGARALLVDMWNRANPRATVQVIEVAGSTVDQRSAMESLVGSGRADVLNLDIIHIPYFSSRGLLAPVEIPDLEDFLGKPLEPGRVAGGGPEAFWAVPFNSDVGMLFERPAPDPVAAADAGLGEVLDGIPDQSAWFAAQLTSLSSATHEAFTVNFLEHALSRDEEVLDRTTGRPARELEKWQEALEPLRTALVRGRITSCDGETDTRDKFSELRLRYMRNWPVKFRELQMMGDAEAAAGQLAVRALPRGVLGGQSLAVVAGSPEEGRAGEFVRFMTDGPAQKILASYGLVPTRIEPYNTDELRPFVPHLASVRGAVEEAVPRPVHENYAVASGLVHEYGRAFLEGTDPLPTEFLDKLLAALP